MSQPIDLLDPYMFIWCCGYLPGTDESGYESGYAYPHETRLLIKVY